MGKAFALAMLIMLAVAVAGTAPAAAQARPGAVETNTCATAFNDICEDPGLGPLTRCAIGTDRADCRGRARESTPSATFFGRDDRVLMDTRVYPWSAIGRLEFDDGGQCSGALIDPNTVLTAAHCLIRADGLSHDGRFVTARGRPGGALVARMIKAHVLDRVADPDLASITRGDIDWALVRLDQPLGDQAGYLAVEVVRDNRPLRRDLINTIALVLITVIAAAATHGRTRMALAGLAGIGVIVFAVFAVRTVAGYDPREERLWQAGYSWDTGVHLSGSTACRLQEFRASGMIGHDCDTLRGDSGSPLLVRRGEDWAIIGVISHTRVAWRNEDGSMRIAPTGSYAASTLRVPDPEAVFGDAP